MLPGMIPLKKDTLSPFEEQVIDYFCDGAKLLGVQRSVAELYGLLFVTPRPLSLDDLVNRLGISKGSASQGMKTLRAWGAVRVQNGGEGGRRLYYEPDVELKRLVGGFIKQQVRPHLASGEKKLESLQDAASATTEPRLKEFYEDRVDKLGSWTKRGRIVLPVLQKLLGS